MLEEAAAVQGTRGAVLLLEGKVPAGLVVPDGVAAGPGFVDPVDLALQEERPAGRRDLDRVGRAERLVAARAAEAERDLEEPRRRVVRFLGAQEDVACREKLLLLRAKGREVRRRDDLLPAREAAARDGFQPGSVAGGLEPQPVRPQARHEVVQGLVQEVSELARVQPLALAPDLVRGRQVEDVLVEVRARALRELLEPRGRQRHAVPAGVELRGVRREPTVPRRERGGRAGLLGPRPVTEPRIRAGDLDVPIRRAGRLAEPREPPFDLVERRAVRHERRGGRQGAREVLPRRRGAAFARPEEREEHGRGKTLGILQDVAVREREDGASAEAREERVELGDPRGGSRLARQREPAARSGAIQDLALGVEEDGVLVRRSRKARLVEAEDERPRAARPSRAAETRRMDVTGSRARGVDGEGVDRFAQATGGFGRGETPLGQVGELGEEVAERDRRRAVDVARAREEGPDDLAARPRERRQRDGSARDGRKRGEEAGDVPTERFGREKPLLPRGVRLAGRLLVDGRGALARDEGLQPRSVARRSRDDAGAPQEPRGADAADARSAAGVGAEVRAPVREQALQGGRAEVPRHEVEDVEDPLPGAGVRDGHAVRERARHSVLRRELVDERPVRRVVVEDDLHLVDVQALVQDAAEDGADLVLLAQGLCERDAGRRVRRVEDVLGEGNGSARPRVEEGLLEGRQLEAGGTQQVRLRREPVSSGAGGRRALQDLGRVGGAEPGEDRLVGLRERGELGALAPVVEGGGSQVARSHAGAAQLVERAVERAVEADVPAKGAEIRVGPEDLVARALDDREELRAREEAPALGREGRPGDAVREREDGRGTEVQVRGAGARESVEDLLADGKRRDEEDLLVHGVGRAEVRQPLEEPVLFDGGRHGRSLKGARRAV